MHRLQELVRLHRMGTKARQVAKLLGMSPNTERSYRRALDAAGLLQGPIHELPALSELEAAVRRKKPPKASPAHERSSVAEWEPRIASLLEKGLTPGPIYDRLRQEEAEFAGSYWAIRRICLRLQEAKGVHPKDVAIPVETPPGDVAQVDFGYIGKLFCPTTHVPKKAWVFVMTLGFSRHMYAEIVFDQKADTWQSLHVRAFQALGGVPRLLVPDNLKAAVVKAAFSVDTESELHRSYRELARHYGCKIDPTPPYTPKAKGKVESAVKYVKNNALAGREEESLDEANQALRRWVEEIAGQRIHGTHHRRPLELFREREQPHLLPLPTQPYHACIWKKAKVHQDTHIAFEKRLYSVPWSWVGKEVWLRATPGTVEIYGGHERIATHPRLGRERRSTCESHLPEHRRDWRQRSEQYWIERAARIGPQSQGLVRGIVEADQVLCQLRKIQAIVTFLERYPKHRAEAASQRAVFYGSLSYISIKNILNQALDIEPLPSVVMPKGNFTRPRFARNIHDLVATYAEDAHEPN